MQLPECPASRPLVIGVMKCIRELIVKPQFDIMAGLERTVNENSTECCLILWELCQMPGKISKIQNGNELKETEVSGGEDIDQVDDGKSENSFVESKVLQGHHDTITALAVGDMNRLHTSCNKLNCVYVAELLWREESQSAPYFAIKMHNGAVFATCLDGKWLFTRGFDKTVNVQEWSGDEFQTDLRTVGSIPCDSVITTLLCWQGKLFVGYGNKNIKVFYYGK